MKKIKFETIAGRTFEVQFIEDDFLNYIVHCYNNIPMISEIAIYINNLHSKLFDVPFDSVIPQSIKISPSLSRNFRNKFQYIIDAQQYNI